MDIKILGMRDKVPEGYAVVINSTSKSKDFGVGLSPFFLGPIPLYKNRVAQLMENAWQYAKLYQVHTENGEPSKAYWNWAERGWAEGVAHRYPMGRDSKPLCSLWEGAKLSYTRARRVIYAPLYSEAVRKTDAFNQLVAQARAAPVAIRDFDGYDHDALGMTLDQVMACETRKMGHAFVLKMMLLNRTDLLERIAS